MAALCERRIIKSYSHRLRLLLCRSAPAGSIPAGDVLLVSSILPDPRICPIGRVIGSGILNRVRADQESAKAGFWELSSSSAPLLPDRL